MLCCPRYDVELFQRIETLIGKKLPEFPTEEEEVMMLVERVSEAQRFARLVSRPFWLRFPFVSIFKKKKCNSTLILEIV